MAEPTVQTNGGINPATGHFVRGNTLARGGVRPGGGRRPDAVLQIERDLLTEWGSPDKMQFYFEQLDGLAHDPDPDVAMKAITILLNRLFGLPKERKDLASAPQLTIVVSE
jgi:hypothetical protein